MTRENFLEPLKIQPANFAGHHTFRSCCFCVIFIIVRVNFMKYFFQFLFVLLLASSVTAQKGVDNQTKKIREEGNKTTNANRGNESSNRSFDWGKGKTKTRGRLDNPYKMNSRRDILVNTIIEVLKEKKLIIDESASRINEGIIITQPFVFAKGAVITRNELSRYAILPGETAWTRGRYTLTIEVQSIDGIQNNVYVLAKVEGRSENGLISQWSTLESTGIAEDEFLIKLVELVTGTSPDGVLDTKPQNR